MRNPTQDEVHDFQHKLRQAIENIAEEHGAHLIQCREDMDDTEGCFILVGLNIRFKMKLRENGQRSNHG